MYIGYGVWLCDKWCGVVGLIFVFRDEMENFWIKVMKVECFVGVDKV